MNNKAKGGVNPGSTDEFFYTRRQKMAKVDVVRATVDNVLDSARCSMCGKRPRNTEAVLRVRDLLDASKVATVIHRRCIEVEFETAVDDLEKDDKRFDEYRDKIADKYGLEIA